MKKLIAFDLDGTLAPSKSLLPNQIGLLLNQLLDHFQVCIISGGKYDIFVENVLTNKELDKNKFKNLHLMPTCGTRYYVYENNKWIKVYSEDFSKSEKKQIIEALQKGFEESGYKEIETYGELIEDRESQITLSTLGQDIIRLLGKKGLQIKEDWDPNDHKKRIICDLVQPLIPEFEVKVGGLTSIDVTKPGIDKAYGMKKIMEHLNIKKEDILFIGDHLQEGGNDYPVKAFGIDSLEISSWQETAVAIQTILYIIK
jgi:hypothetical protein